MTEQITLAKEAAQRVFDALVSSMDFGSGFLESDDVAALRALAAAIGVDPNVGTPAEFKAQYPHPYEAAGGREQIAYQSSALTQTVAISVTGQPYTVNVVDDAKMPAFTPCKIGPWNRWCNRPESDPIHQAAEMGAREEWAATR